MNMSFQCLSSGWICFDMCRTIPHLAWEQLEEKAACQLQQNTCPLREWWFVSGAWAASGHQFSLAWVRAVIGSGGRKDVGSVFNRMSVLMMRPGSSHWGLGVSQCLFLFTPQLSWRLNRTWFLFKLLPQVSMPSEAGLGDCLAHLLLLDRFFLSNS